MAISVPHAPAARRTLAVRRRLPAVYRRRRLVAGSVLAGLLAFAGGSVAGVLAGPGGVPASAAGAQPAVARATIVVRAGDTLWSIAREHNGDVPFERYLDALVARNGGAAIQARQVLELP
jgi:LysM repeat protein